MARQLVRALSFLAAAMAVMSLLAVTVDAQASTIAVKNTFPFNRLQVLCDTQPMHFLRPDESFLFQVDPNARTSIACAMTTEVNTEDPRGDIFKSGKFVLWLKAIPRCGTGNTCLWFAGLDGVSVLQTPGGNPVHVYNWP